MSLVSPFSKEHESDPFGDWPQWRKDRGLGPHRGKDFNGLDAGTPIPASGTGVAVGSGWSDALGWWVVIRYEVDGRYVYYGYCHLHAATNLKYGDWVKRGNTVGLLGDSGSASTGAHLHLTASWQNGDPGWTPVIDPMQFFTTSAPAGENFTPISGDDDMTTLELVQTAGGKEGIFYSVNRLQRYAVDGPTTLADYQFFITEQKKSGNVNAKPDVQIVKNLSAFGAIVR